MSRGKQYIYLHARESARAHALTRDMSSHQRCVILMLDLIESDLRNGQISTYLSIHFFWKVMLCHWVIISRRFERKQRLQLQGSSISRRYLEPPASGKASHPRRLNPQQPRHQNLKPHNLTVILVKSE
jgi:hypothetical protein